MNAEQVTKILNIANSNLANHPEYENWMLFDGANITPLNVIIPRFVSTEGCTLQNDPKYLIYKQVWEETVLELGL